MHIRRSLPRSLALLSTVIVVGVLGLSLSVTAFGQNTTPPLSDYTSTVPTPTPTTTKPAPSPTPKSTQTTSTTPPAVSVKPQQASNATPTPTPTPTATAASPKKLAFTGFDLVPLLLVGAVLMGLGAVLLVRRRDAR